MDHNIRFHDSPSRPTTTNQIHELAKTLRLLESRTLLATPAGHFAPPLPRWSRKVKCNKLPGQDKHCLSKNFPCTSPYVQQATSEKKRSAALSRRPRNISTDHSRFTMSAPSLTRPHSRSFHAAPLSTNLNVHYGFQPRITQDTPTKDVLTYIFAPPESSSAHDLPPIVSIRSSTPYDPGGIFRADFALDLVEVFFQIVHTRLPLLNPAQFRNRLGITASTMGGATLHPALVATVVAWGCKFSEHPLLVADRKRPSGQSMLAKTLIDRARDLAEALKVHRIPSADHVVISLLIEPLQSRYHGFWLTAATRHLLGLGINHKSTMANLHFYTVGPAPQEAQGDSTTTTAPSTREQLEGYYTAAHSLARTARQMSRQLWKPSTDSDGISFETLLTFTTSLTEWRERYLNVVGVPNNYDGEWDFVSAVSSCASDATYHVMWIILFNAVDDFNIRELSQTPPPNVVQIEAVKQKVVEEALQSALRIAGLAAVLTSNGYLRLDPAVMHVSCIQAGTLLARLGRPEVTNCIAALEQYSYSYEEAGDQAQELKRLFSVARSGELELNHMASVAPKLPPSSGNSTPQSHYKQTTAHGNSMSVDDPAGPPSSSNGSNSPYSSSSSYSGYGR
ncbi:hypothetical protein BKA70DRAFT_1267409 [Coprinopsis sp. MPI-PUGE-AT-0042]|nr:hypothetical protein BKA70DRAFT_1267409 [Coprinopsis sp. MPI-PUGE-AT-0042]